MGPLDVWRDSLKKFLAARGPEFERLRVTVDAKSDYIELLKGRFMQQETSFEKTNAVFETRMEEIKVRQDAAIAEMIAHRNRLCEEAHRLSSYRRAFGVESNMAGHQLSAKRTKIENVSGQLTQQMRLKKESEQNATDIQYEVNGARRGPRIFRALKVSCRLVSTAL